MEPSSRYYTLSRESNKLVIRIEEEIDEEDLDRLLAFIVIESIRRKSQLTQEQADELAAEIDAAVWAKLSRPYER